MSSIQNPIAFLTDLHHTNCRFETDQKKNIERVLDEHQNAIIAHQNATLDYEDAHQTCCFKSYRIFKVNSRLIACEKRIEASKCAADKVIIELFTEIIRTSNPLPQIVRTQGKLSESSSQIKELTAWFEEDQKVRKCVKDRDHARSRLSQRFPNADLIANYFVAASDTRDALIHSKQTLQDLRHVFKIWNQSPINKAHQAECNTLIDRIEIALNASRYDAKFAMELIKKISQSNVFRELLHNSAALSDAQVQGALVHLSEAERKTILAWLRGDSIYAFDPSLLVALHKLSVAVKELLNHNLVCFANALVSVIASSEDNDLLNELTALKAVIAKHRTTTEQADAIHLWFNQGDHSVLKKIMHLSLLGSDMTLFSYKILYYMEHYMRLSTLALDRDRFNRIPEELATVIMNYETQLGWHKNADAEETLLDAQ